MLHVIKRDTYYIVHILRMHYIVSNSANTNVQEMFMFIFVLLQNNYMAAKGAKRDEHCVNEN